MKVHDALDEAQAEAAAFRGGHAYVAAGPGAGKTRVLVERYRALRTEGVAAGEILVLTFSRRAVQELRDRLVSNGFPAGELDIRTFHGFAARVIGGGLARFRDGRLLDGFSRALVFPPLRTLRARHNASETSLPSSALCAQPAPPSAVATSAIWSAAP
jgi:hypothetical protein